MRAGSITSYQSTNGPDRQRNMVDQFHVHVHVKPCWRLGKEAVGVSCDVPFAQRGNEVGLEAFWVKRCQVDAFQYLLARRVATIAVENNVGASYRKQLERG